MKTRDNKKNKPKDLTLTVNDVPIDLPMRIDPASGRVQFQKVVLLSLRNMLEGQEICLILQIFLMMRDYLIDRVLKKGEYLVRRKRESL